MTREPYQDPGSRVRFEYRLTPAGHELEIALAALQQWGDEHLPRAEGPSRDELAREVRSALVSRECGYSRT